MSQYSKSKQPGKKALEFLQNEGSIFPKIGGSNMTPKAKRLQELQEKLNQAFKMDQSHMKKLSENGS